MEWNYILDRKIELITYHHEFESTISRQVFTAFEVSFQGKCFGKTSQKTVKTPTESFQRVLSISL